MLRAFYHIIAMNVSQISQKSFENPLKTIIFFLIFKFFLHHYKNVQIETRKCSKKKLKQIFRDNEHKEKEKREKEKKTLSKM